ncbi:hypothetical protein AAFX91_40935, partial [Bradyrhizobium sp. 31Argb]|uniref:hypothetical protein n=1 Tax=Bradyrhizobium sp. 31Argb TaxID=3141247 RepID=UPI003748DCE0
AFSAASILRLVFVVIMRSVYQTEQPFSVSNYRRLGIAAGGLNLWNPAVRRRRDNHKPWLVAVRPI